MADHEELDEGSMPISILPRSNPFGLRPLDKLESMISEIDNIHAALPELLALRNEMEQTHRQSLDLCVKVAMGEIVANSGSKDPVSQQERAQDTKDVEALAGVVDLLQTRLGHLCNSSLYKELLEQKEELEYDLRTERAKVQAKEDALTDSILIKEGLERDLARPRETLESATDMMRENKSRDLEAELKDVQGCLDRAAGKYADLDRDHRKVLEALQVLKNDTARWNYDKAALNTQVDTLINDKTKLEGDVSTLQSQIRTIQAEKIDIESSSAAEELRRVRLANSKIQSEVTTLKTRIRELEEKVTSADRLGRYCHSLISELFPLEYLGLIISGANYRSPTGTASTAGEDFDYQKRRKILWKEHAKELKKSLEEKEAELESARSDNQQLVKELKRIHDRAKNEAALLARRFSALRGRDQDNAEEGHFGEDDGADEGEEQASNNGNGPVLQGYKAPVYNMYMGYRDTGGSQRRVSQTITGTGEGQGDSDVPDVALKPKSTNPVPQGWAVVKEVNALACFKTLLTGACAASQKGPRSLVSLKSHIFR